MSSVKQEKLETVFFKPKKVTLPFVSIYDGNLKPLFSTGRSSSRIEPTVAVLYDDAGVNYDHAFERIFLLLFYHNLNGFSR